MYGILLAMRPVLFLESLPENEFSSLYIKSIVIDSNPYMVVFR